MNNIRFYNWQKISFFNLFLVSCVGVILRYKIIFPLPFIDQKFLLHAHSHFAFSGWITQIVMAFIVKYLHDKDVNIPMQKYEWLFTANLLSAYGMLFSFPFEGYAGISITFSTLSIFTAYAFAFFVWRDINSLKLKNISDHWFKAALALNAVSSLGAFSLAFMMATKTLNQNMYLASVYFFLHFQYNGWFFFACMGLLHDYLLKKNLAPIYTNSKIIFWLFFSAVVPAYFLSALWLPIPEWIYIMVILAAVAQCAGYVILLRHIMINRKEFISSFAKPVKWLWVLAMLSLSIKLLLQLVSVIPSLSQLTTGFRPIVIGYLHLVLLGVITIFLIGYFAAVNSVDQKIFFRGVSVFVTGIIINEMLLMLQGIEGLSYTSIPFINEALFIAALIIVTGLLISNIGLRKPGISNQGVSVIQKHDENHITGFFKS